MFIKGLKENSKYATKNDQASLPTENPWETLFDSLYKFSDDFMNTREQPKHQEKEDIFS